MVCGSFAVIVAECRSYGADGKCLRKSAATNPFSSRAPSHAGVDIIICILSRRYIRIIIS